MGPKERGCSLGVTISLGRYTVGPLEIDVEAQRVSVGGVPIQVSRMELRLLADLVEHRRQSGRATTC